MCQIYVLLTSAKNSSNACFASITPFLNLLLLYQFVFICRGSVRNACSMLMTLSLSERDVYEEVFETAFLQQSAAFYSVSSACWNHFVLTFSTVRWSPWVSRPCLWETLRVRLFRRKNRIFGENSNLCHLLAFGLKLCGQPGTSTGFDCCGIQAANGERQWIPKHCVTVKQNLENQGNCSKFCPTFTYCSNTFQTVTKTH